MAVQEAYGIRFMSGVKFDGLHPELAKRVAAVCIALPYAAVISGTRDYADQVRLRRIWCGRGKCSNAANPDYRGKDGRRGSKHMIQDKSYVDPSGAKPGDYGYAVDFTVIWYGGKGSTSARRREIQRVARKSGLHFPIRGEWWHAELAPGSVARPPGARRTITGKIKRRTLRLRRGRYMRGTDVKVIQGVAGVKPDGIFGPGTERAVVVMQKNLGLVPDGIVGPGTWAKVDSILAFLSKQ